MACSIALFVLTATVFLRSACFGFTNFDDGQYVYENPWVNSGLTRRGIEWAFTTLHGEVSYWHPLTWISHQLDCQLFGLRPGPHHLTSVWIHVANTLLVFRIFLQLRLGRRLCFFVAALFGVHPLHVESVAWIAERKDVLYGLFWFSALWAFIVLRQRASRACYACSLVLFVAALMSKPTAVTLPVVLLLLEFLLRDALRKSEASIESGIAIEVRGMNRWSRVVPIMPFVALSIASGMLTIIAQAKVGALQRFDYLTLGDRVANALVSYALYLRQTALPLNLCASYLQTRAYSPIAIVLAPTVLGTASCFSIRNYQKHPLICLGWLWFTLTLVPNIGLVQVGPQSMADRYMYLPLIGLSIGLGGSLPYLRRIGRLNLELAGAAAVLACGALSFAQLGHWENGVALFSRAVALDHDNWVAQQGLGLALTEQNRPDEALPHLRRALDLPGNNAQAHRSLGLCFMSKGQFAEAFTEFKSALHADSSSPETCFLLAKLLIAHPELERANGIDPVVLAERGVSLRSEVKPEDWVILMRAYLAAGRSEDAVRASRKASEIARRLGNPALAKDSEGFPLLRDSGRTRKGSVPGVPRSISETDPVPAADGRD
jgi:tetratricopeptide (TPR) repeat protein